MFAQNFLSLPMPNFFWYLLPVLILAGFVAFWSGIVWVIARVGGWHRLARRYAVDQAPPNTQTWSFQTALVASGRYRNALTVGVSPQGLYLSPPFLFRVGHPRLVVPWALVGSFRAEKQFLGTAYTALLGPPGETVELTLYNESLVRAIEMWLSQGRQGARFSGADAA